MVCNGLQELFNLHLLLYVFAIVKSTPSAKWFLQWFPFIRGVDLRLLLYGFLMVYKRCLIYVCCYMVLQWFTRGVLSTSAAIWISNGLQEVFNLHLLLYGFAIVKSTPSAK
jgi:hypothetical protein